MLNKSVDNFFSALIPEGLRTSLKIDSSIYVRVQALTVMLVSITAVIGVGSIIVMGMHVAFHRELLKYDAISCAAFLFLAFQTWLFYHYQNHWMSSLAFTTFYFLVLTLFVIMSGGYDAPGKVMLLTCPLVSFLIGGRQEGMQNTFITLLFGLALVVLKVIDFKLPNIFRDENPYVIFIVDWIYTNLILLACILVYETEMEKAHDRSWNQQLEAVKIERYEGLDRFFHSLIPSGLRNTLDPISWVYVRVRMLSVMLNVATLMSLLSAIALISVHVLFYQKQLKYDTVIVGILAAFGFQTWLFYRFQNYGLSGMMLSYFYFLLVMLLILIGGGYDSPIMGLLVLSPVVFFMIGGLREGVQNALFVIITGVALGSLKSVGFELHNVFSDVSPQLTFGLVWIISVLSIALCIMAYDAELQKRG